MTRESRAGVSRMLMVSTGAGSVTYEVERRLSAAFPGYVRVDFDKNRDLRRELTANATLVVAGGDGTIGHAARMLAGSRCTLAILPLGTYNNFARSLGIPASLPRAITVAREGRIRPITLGRINGRYFLEAAAIGMFGEAILLGEKAKDRKFGSLGRELRAVARAEPFGFTMSGDFEGHGRARSLVFTNTPTTGSRMVVGDATPADGFLELSLGVGASKRDIVERVVASALRDKPDDGIRLRFRSLSITTKPRSSVVTDNQRAGRTPVAVQAVRGALRVRVPR